MRHTACKGVRVGRLPLLDVYVLIRGRVTQADEVTCVAWGPLQQALAIGTSGGDVLCFNTALHSLQVCGGTALFSCHALSPARTCAVVQGM